VPPLRKAGTSLKACTLPCVLSRLVIGLMVCTKLSGKVLDRLMLKRLGGGAVMVAAVLLLEE